MSTPALGRFMQRNTAEDFSIRGMAQDSIKIDLRFDLNFELKIDLKIKLMIENWALLSYPSKISHPFNVLQFVLLLLSHKQALYRSIAITIIRIIRLCGNFYHTVW